VATTTPRIGLTKPDLTDLVDVAVLNTNFDKIDSNIASTKIQATKPTTANAGDLWWDSDTGTLYVYYVGTSSSSWVAATSDPINIGVVANQTERDAQYPTPAQGMRVFRTDLGVTQTYYGLYNVSTNPGGRDVAGWYDTEKTFGLVPVRATTATIVSGSGSTNALGKITFTGATNILIDGLFSSNFARYKIVLNANLAAGETWLELRGRTSGSSITTTNYLYNCRRFESGTIQTTDQNTQASALTTVVGPTAGAQTVVIDINNPNLATATNWFGESYAIYSNATSSRAAFGGIFNGTNIFDGFAITPQSSNLNGSLQIFGYNDK